MTIEMGVVETYEGLSTFEWEFEVNKFFFKNCYVIS